MGNQPPLPNQGYQNPQLNIDRRYPSQSPYSNNQYANPHQYQPNYPNLPSPSVQSSKASQQYLYNQKPQYPTQFQNAIPSKDRPPSSQKPKPAFKSNFEEIDKIKVGMKMTRDKVDRLINQYTVQIQGINQEITKQKQNGLSNKKKAVYLLKQKKQFQKQIQNLQTRKQVVFKTLNDLNQQHLDREMITVLQQSNNYMKNVQQQLERMDWRGVLADVAANRYNNQLMIEAQTDPDVELMYQQMERQVLGSKILKSVKKIQIDRNSPRVQVADIQRILTTPSIIVPQVSPMLLNPVRLQVDKKQAQRLSGLSALQIRQIESMPLATSGDFTASITHPINNRDSGNISLALQDGIVYYNPLAGSYKIPESVIYNQSNLSDNNKSNLSENKQQFLPPPIGYIQPNSPRLSLEQQKQNLVQPSTEAITIDQPNVLNYQNIPTIPNNTNLQQQVPAQNNLLANQPQQQPTLPVPHIQQPPVIPSMQQSPQMLNNAFANLHLNRDNSQNIQLNKINSQTKISIAGLDNNTINQQISPQNYQQFHQMNPQIKTMQPGLPPRVNNNFKNSNVGNLANIPFQQQPQMQFQPQMYPQNQATIFNPMFPTLTKQNSANFPPRPQQFPQQYQR